MKGYSSFKSIRAVRSLLGRSTGLHASWKSDMHNYSDIFKDPLDIGLESPFSSAYSYYHVWDNVPLASGDVLE